MSQSHATAAVYDRPIVTLTTDFGRRDFYVAAMEAVLIRNCPSARVIEITHEIARDDIVAGTITLERAIASFDLNSQTRVVHLAVIDPGVGTDRRILVARLSHQLIVCPDNGLITWAIRRDSGAEIFYLTWRPEIPAIHTFHGRDIMAPAAAMLASGTPIEQLAKPINDPILLDISPYPGQCPARIIHLDAFGNATTNIERNNLGPFAHGNIRIGDTSIGPLRQTYADVPSGQPLALIGSNDLLEIAVRDGSAAKDLGLKVGDELYQAG